MFSGSISSHVQGLLMHRSKFTCIKLPQSNGKYYITEKQCWLLFWLILMFVLTAVLAKKQNKKKKQFCIQVSHAPPKHPCVKIYMQKSISMRLQPQLEWISLTQEGGQCKFYQRISGICPFKSQLCRGMHYTCLQ